MVDYLSEAGAAPAGPTGGEATPQQGEAAPEDLPSDPAHYGPAPQSFEQMDLRDEVLGALREMGFERPLPVQSAAFRPIMAGRDLIVQSRTGSGKTAAFGIPFAQKLIDPASSCQGGRVQVLVLTPTRELALQVATEVNRIASRRGIHVVPVYGGAPMGKQVDALAAGGQVVSGTPGRVLDHLRRGTLHLHDLRILVLDEADEMLSMGFYEEIIEIIKRCPLERQTLLFSATMPEDVERISRRHMRSPLKLNLSQDFVGVHEISHVYYMVSGMGRPRDLLRVLEVERPESAIIFCNTREETGLVAEYLRSQGLDAEAISSDLTQAERERVMARTKAKRLKYLVATDVAARGIDISNLSHVVNYTFPESAEVYIHRTGRTGRAGKSGTAISLIGPREIGNFYYLKLTYKIRPEERLLPSEEEVQTLREGHFIDRLTGEFGLRDPGATWRALVRRILSMESGEQLLGCVLERQLTAPPPAAEAEAGIEARPPRAPRRHRDDSEESESPRRRQEREARGHKRDDERRERLSARHERQRERDRDAERPGRRRERERREPQAAPAQEQAPPPAQVSRGVDGPPGADAGERKRRRRGGRGHRRGEGATTPAETALPPAEGGGGAAMGRAPSDKDVIHVDDGREFWEAWVDSRGGDRPAAGEPQAAPAEQVQGEGVRPSQRSSRRRRGPAPERPALAPGEQRLYLNLGRRDGMGAEDIASFLEQRGLPAFPSEVLGTHTYLSVPDEKVEQVVAALNGQFRGDREVLCERAKR